MTDEPEFLQIANDIMRDAAKQPDIATVHQIRDALLKAKKDAIDHCILQAMKYRWGIRESLYDNKSATDEQKNHAWGRLTDLIQDMHNEASVRVGSGSKSFDMYTEGPDPDGESDEEDIVKGMNKDAVWF
jgi:hypothetical protein